MSAQHTIRVPFQADTLRVLADDLLSGLSQAREADLSAAVVLLPSTRACRSLGHAILEASGRDALLLPRIQTVDQWTGEMATAVGLAADKGPDDRLRSLILAPSLASLPRLADNPESAPGLARELIDFFDEVRLHNQTELLLDPARLTDLQITAGAAEAEALVQDMTLVHEAWALYRELVPRDATDHLVDLAAVLADDPPQPLHRPELVVVAAFSRVDPTRAVLLRSALASGESGRLYLPTVAGPLARTFVTTWGAAPSPTDPLASARTVEQLLTGKEPAYSGTDSTLRDRLDKLGLVADPSDLLAPTGPLTLVPCGDAEAECRFIADRVATVQSGPAGETKRITIGVNDPQLATRVRAHLKDAGLDADDTHGDPLAALPAGLLARFILRSALTELRIEPLLEVLTHPFVRLPLKDDRHGHWTLRLEQMFRRDQGPRGGLAALNRRAGERDEAALNLCRKFRPDPGAGMVDFVTRIVEAFAPLLPFVDGRPRPWPELLTALRATWAMLAPKYDLASDKVRADIDKLHDLLGQLEKDASYLPPVSLAEFSSELGRLLAAENAAAHRRPHLPVVIAGLVEARLERADVLILAGLRDGIFPKKSARPLLLAGAVRERLGLPGWSAALARDAELFTRLLHGAPRIWLTWSTEHEGTPCLPSAFVSRLELVLPPSPPGSPLPQEWRTRPVPWAEIQAAEEAFQAEPAAVPVAASIRPLTRLSWSALDSWRDCPYRALMERGFALHREEEVQAEFRAMEYGHLVHGALQDWLDPQGAGYAALVAGDATAALAALSTAADTRFEPGSDELPQRRLWLETFRGAFAGLVHLETERFRAWRPVALEREFEVSLNDLRSWTSTEAGVEGLEVELASAPAHTGDVVLRGTVDRVDLAQDGTGRVCVIDYKTGVLPTAGKVADLEEMQILLYAAAAEMGALQLPAGTSGVQEGFYYAVNPDKPGGPTRSHLVADEDGGRELLVRGAARLVELATAMADPAGTFPRLPREVIGDAPTRLPCGRCDFRGVCRVEEMPLPALTVRKLDKLVNRKELG